MASWTPDPGTVQEFPRGRATAETHRTTELPTVSATPLHPRSVPAQRTKTQLPAEARPHPAEETREVLNTEPVPVPTAELEEIPPQGQPPCIGFHRVRGGVRLPQELKVRLDLADRQQFSTQNSPSGLLALQPYALHSHARLLCQLTLIVHPDDSLTLKRHARGS
jgi:hypothetical protein